MVCPPWLVHSQQVPSSSHWPETSYFTLGLWRLGRCQSSSIALDHHERRFQILNILFFLDVLPSWLNRRRLDASCVSHFFVPRTLRRLHFFSPLRNHVLVTIRFTPDPLCFAYKNTITGVVRACARFVCKGGRGNYYDTRGAEKPGEHNDKSGTLCCFDELGSSQSCQGMNKPRRKTVASAHIPQRCPERMTYSRRNA